MKFLKFLLILFKDHIDLPCGHAQIKKKNLVIKQEGNREKKIMGETHKQPRVKKKGDWVPLSTFSPSHQIIQSYMCSLKHQQICICNA